MADEMIWKKVTRCGNTSCVEIASHDGGVAIRDSKDPLGPRLTFTRAAWAGFRAALASGILGDRRDQRETRAARGAPPPPSGHHDATGKSRAPGG